MTEIAVRDSGTLAAKIEYAKFLATSGLLPKDYRQNPGNILFAYEYGELLGLPAIAAITGIHVIEGKPSISAGLISALVRRAGHRLRVIGDEHQAQAQLTRSDDPGFTYKSVWTMERAKQAGLLSKSNWQRYPAAMLKARAVSEVARDACQEVLLGIQYTADELGGEDDGGELVHDGFPAAPDGRLALHQMSEEEKAASGNMARSQRVEHEALRADGAPPAGAVEVVGELDPADPWVTGEPEQQSTVASKAQHDKLTKLLLRLEITKARDVNDLIEWVVGRTIHKRDDPALTRSEVTQVTSLLEDAIEAAEGDTAEASSQVWIQYKAAKPTVDA